MLARHITPKGILGVFVFIWISVSIITIPIKILRETYFSNKVTIEITYTDRTTKTKLVSSNEYYNWLTQHNGIHPVFGSKIEESNIYTAVRVYGLWTKNN